jgi:phospholipid-binding lipoprotein MlaA
MKRRASLLPLLLVVSSVSLLSSCTSVPRKRLEVSSSAAVRNNKLDAHRVKVGENGLDEYAAAPVADPLEPVNRGIFWLNDGIYTIVLRPISKGYEKVVPKLVRESLDNLFANAKFPIRFVNCALQGNFKRALQETGGFLVNSTIGFAGVVRQSDHFPALADALPRTPVRRSPNGVSVTARTWCCLCSDLAACGTQWDWQAITL